MNKKLGQEPAFPNTDCETFSNDGMSKRFYAACAAMQGILSGELVNLRSDIHGDTAYSVNCTRTFNKTKLIQNAYAIADELLKQENNE